MKSRYNPRNRNPAIDANRQSWSTAFDERVQRRREYRHPRGFRVPGEDR